MGNVAKLWFTFSVQVFWNYHTMLGVGSLFLLEKIHGKENLSETVRYRIVCFFNGQPYLIPYAISAISREIKNDVDESKILKFSQSIVGLLGAIGDHYYWNGLKPILLLTILFSALIYPNMVFIILLSVLSLIIYNYIQCSDRLNGLRVGSEKGFKVISELKKIKQRWGFKYFPKITG